MSAGVGRAAARGDRARRCRSRCCVTASAARGGRRGASSASCPQGPLDVHDYTRWAPRNVGAAAVRDLLGRRSTRPGRRRRRLVGVRRGRRRAPPATGVATLPFVFGAPDWVLALDGHDCQVGNCPPYAPQGERGAGRLARLPRRRRRPLRPRRQLLGRAPRAARAPDPRLADLERAELAHASASRSRTCGATRSCSTPPTTAITGRRPGGEDHPRRDVRHPARRAQAGDRGLGLPREALPPARARSATSTASPRIRTRRSSTKVPSPGRAAARRAWSPPSDRRRRALDHRDRLGVGRRPEPAQPRARRARPTGCARRSGTSSPSAASSTDRGVDLVLVARQHRRRRAACASGARSRGC